MAADRGSSPSCGDSSGDEIGDGTGDRAEGGDGVGDGDDDVGEGGGVNSASISNVRRSGNVWPSFAAHAVAILHSLGRGAVAGIGTGAGVYGVVGSGGVVFSVALLVRPVVVSNTASAGVSSVTVVAIGLGTR